MGDRLGTLDAVGIFLFCFYFHYFVIILDLEEFRYRVFHHQFFCVDLCDIGLSVRVFNGN